MPSDRQRNRARLRLSFFLSFSEFKQLETEREGKEVRRVIAFPIAPSFFADSPRILSRARSQNRAKPKNKSVDGFST